MTDHSEASKKRLSPEEFQSASEMWRSGNHTLDDLSEQFGVSKTALHRRFKRNGITKGEYRQDADDAIREEMRKRAAERATEFTNSFEDLRDFGFKLNSVIMRRVAKEISNSAQGQTSLALLKDTMRTLATAQEIVNKSFETARSIAGDLLPRDAERELPILTIESLTQEDVEEIRRQQKLEDDELYGTDGDDESMLDDIEGVG